MDANTELDAVLGRKPRGAIHHAILNLAGAAHGVPPASELNQTSITCALHHAPVMHGNSRIDQIAPQRPDRASVRSSSEPASRLSPTTSAARIAASFRVSVMRSFRHNNVGDRE